MARITDGGHASVRAIGEIARRMGKKKIVQDGEKIIKRLLSPDIIGYTLGAASGSLDFFEHAVCYGASQISPDGLFDWALDSLAWLGRLLQSNVDNRTGLMLGQQNDLEDLLSEIPHPAGLMLGQQNDLEDLLSEIPHPAGLMFGQQNDLEDLLFEISHPAHREHKLKLMTGTRHLTGTPFMCDGCKEPGYGPRYTCDSRGGGQSLDLHTRCARADDPLFDLQTLVHPLFGYGKQFEFRFLHREALSPVDDRICDACGEPTRGYAYHCSEQDVDLHPCCASLPDRFIHDGRAFDLHRRASRPCALCPDNEGQRRWFWAYSYRYNLEDDEAVELHVACLKEMARRSWEAYYRNQDVGDGALNVDSMLENMFSSTFGDIAGTLASFITALVFGSLIVKM